MTATVCTCLRREHDLQLEVRDPECPAPCHDWDEEESA